MARTPSNMLPLNTVASEFSLLDTVTGKILSLQDLRGETATVINKLGAIDSRHPAVWGFQPPEPFLGRQSRLEIDCHDAHGIYTATATENFAFPSRRSAAG